MNTPNTIKRIGLLAVFTAIAIPGFSQLFSLNSQFYLNQYAFNPAFAGTDNAINGLLLYRQDWASFDDAPTTMMATFQMPFKEQKFGLGGYVYRSTFGLNAITGGQLSYAYHLNVQEKLRISMGLGLNIWNSSIDFSNLGGNINDPTLLSRADGSTIIDGTAGINIATDNFFMSFSAANLLENAYSFQEDGSDLPPLFQDNARQFFWMTGFSIPIKDSMLDLEPAVLIKYTPGMSPQADLNARLIYRDVLWLGFTYRPTSAFVYSAGVRLKESIDLGYAFDNSTTALGAFGGSHEIVLRYRHSLEKEPKDTVPLASDIYDTTDVDTQSVVRGEIDTLVEEPIDTLVEQPLVEAEDTVDAVEAAADTTVLAEEPETPKVEEPEVEEEPEPETPKVEIVEEEPEPETPEVEVAEEEPEPETPEVEEPEVETPEVAVKQIGEEKVEQFDERNPYNYVIAGSFSNSQNAIKLKKEMEAKGYDAQVIEHKSRGFYRVSLFKSTDSASAGAKMMQYRKDLNNPYIWLLENESYQENAAEQAKKEAEESKEPATVKTETVKGEKVEVLDEDNNFYHIIAGSFSSIENAQKLRDELQAKGYKDAKILKDTDRGLYRVSAYSTLDASEARNKLKTYQSSLNPNIWMLKK